MSDYVWVVVGIVYLIGWLAAARWYIGPRVLTPKRCHGEMRSPDHHHPRGVQWIAEEPGSWRHCWESHRRECWRRSVARRTTGTGVRIAFASLFWPLVLPFLLLALVGHAALAVTPETAEERQRRIAELEAEVADLERQVRGQR